MPLSQLLSEVWSCQIPKGKESEVNTQESISPLIILLNRTSFTTILANQKLETFSHHVRRHFPNPIFRVASLLVGPSLKFNKFTLFPKIPLDLQIVIWKAAEDRCINFSNTHHRPNLDPSIGWFLLVNFEVDEIFSKTSQRCFYQLGKNAVLINPEKDTLRFSKSIQGLRKIMQKHPESMSKTRRIEIFPTCTKSEKMLDVCCLSSIQIITVRAIRKAGEVKPVDRSHPTVYTLEFLRPSFILEAQKTGIAHIGLSVAAIFSPSRGNI